MVEDEQALMVHETYQTHIEIDYGKATLHVEDTSLHDRRTVVLGEWWL